MEKLLGSFSLGLILRCFFTGVFGVVSYRVATLGMVDLHAVLRSDPNVLGIAIFTGVVVYGVHRSLVYPVIEWLFDTHIVARARRKVPLISNQTLASLTKRWDRGADTAQPNSGRVRQIVFWSDLAHMQYTSVLCTICGALVAKLEPNLKVSPCGPVITATAVIAVSAIISDWRLRSVEDHLLQHPVIK